MRTDNYLQIDITHVPENGYLAEGYLYTPEGTIKIAMAKTDYEHLQRNGFFIRSGKEKDSAGVLNTTVPYYPFTPPQEQTKSKKFSSAVVVSSCIVEKNLTVSFDTEEEGQSHFDNETKGNWEGMYYSEHKTENPFVKITLFAIDGITKEKYLRREMFGYTKTTDL